MERLLKSLCGHLYPGTTYLIVMKRDPCHHHEKAPKILILVFPPVKVTFFHHVYQGLFTTGISVARKTSGKPPFHPCHNLHRLQWEHFSPHRLPRGRFQGFKALVSDWRKSRGMFLWIFHPKFSILDLCPTTGFLPSYLGERGTKGPIQDAIVTTGSMAFLVPVPKKEAFQYFWAIMVHIRSVIHF